MHTTAIENKITILILLFWKGFLSKNKKRGIRNPIIHIQTFLRIYICFIDNKRLSELTLSNKNEVIHSNINKIKTKNLLYFTNIILLEASYVNYIYSTEIDILLLCLCIF